MINGSRISNGPDIGSTAVINGGQTSTTVLDGFRIIHGRGSTLGTIKVGGGIFIASGYDIDAQVRIVDGNGDKIATVDMGADEVPK